MIITVLSIYYFAVYVSLIDFNHKFEISFAQNLLLYSDL
jgi:hypothetical protein